MKSPGNDPFYQLTIRVFCLFMCRKLVGGRVFFLCEPMVPKIHPRSLHPGKLTLGT